MTEMVQIVVAAHIEVKNVHFLLKPGSQAPKQYHAHSSKSSNILLGLLMHTLRFK